MPEPIPQFSLTRQMAEVGPELQAAVLRVLASGRYAQGPECAAFEAEATEAIRGPERLHALACSSGTDALHLALRAAGVRTGEVVVTTPFTFFATASAILLAGARPEFVDIRPADFNLDPELLPEALQRRRKERVAAVLPVHLYGALADMPAILAAAGETPVIEDAAQAFGTNGSGRPAGGWGAAGCFSFYPTKNLGACGEGGLVTTRDAALYERLQLLRGHGSRQRYLHETLGWNGRMHEMQAAVLRVKLRRLAAWNERRRDIAAAYEERLLAGGLAAVGTAAQGELGAAPAGLEVLLPQRGEGHIFHQYVIRARRRDALRQFLIERQIFAEVYYPVPLHRQQALRELASGRAFPRAEAAAREVLALPMFPELADSEVDRISSAVTDFYRGGTRA